MTTSQQTPFQVPPIASSTSSTSDLIKAMLFYLSCFQTERQNAEAACAELDRRVPLGVAADSAAAAPVLMRDYHEMVRQLTIVQERCTALMEEKRAAAAKERAAVVAFLRLRGYYDAANLVEDNGWTTLTSGAV